MSIYKSPKILIINLKRFKEQQYREYNYEKISEAVEFPIDEILDIKNYVSHVEDGTKYKLYGIINHFGGMGGGHYTSYSINPIDNKW